MSHEALIPQQFFNNLAGILLKSWRHIGYFLPLQFSQVPTEGLGKGRVQVCDFSIQSENDHGIGNKIEQGSILAFSFAAYLILALVAVL